VQKASSSLIPYKPLLAATQALLLAISVSFVTGTQSSPQTTHSSFTNGCCAALPVDSTHCVRYVTDICGMADRTLLLLPLLPAVLFSSPCSTVAGLGSATSSLLLVQCQEGLLAAVLLSPRSCRQQLQPRQGSHPRL
jgi:hypothetical protein